MKNILIAFLIFFAATGYSQVITKTETTTYNAAGNKIKTVIKTEAKDEVENLNGVTFGIGMGWSYVFDNPKEYFLTTDAAHALQVQELSRSSIVLSSVITIKLNKMAASKTNKGKLYRAVSPGIAAAGAAPTPLKWNERFAINISLNLAELNSGTIAFNKSIDGGIGLGYYVNQFTQVATFFDMQRVRQMRKYFVESYEGQSIPNGTGVYNALDQTDNNLFYNKYYPGVSFKVIFSLRNK